MKGRETEMLVPNSLKINGLCTPGPSVMELAALPRKLKQTCSATSYSNDHCICMYACPLTPPRSIDQSGLNLLYTLPRVPGLSISI